MWLVAGGLGLLQAGARAGVSSQAATHLATATSHLPAPDLQDLLTHHPHLAPQHIIFFLANNPTNSPPQHHVVIQ